ncbi:hypothetical protein GCM10022381_03550 [Leifsonia kafniensis]|uniref:SHOCT domain-containing protein n=1 Tax=Leifsonia kafniensis TaxID=475957 RepID=A0ABP7K374_9MICO
MLQNLTGWHVLIILGVLIVMAAVVVGGVLMIVALARRQAPVGPAAPVDSALSAGASVDPVEQIRKLAELRDQGLLSEEEFQAKRTELLGRI